MPATLPNPAPHVQPRPPPVTAGVPAGGWMSRPDGKGMNWAAQGFEIAGFAWFQGHWDQSEPYASKYEENLVRLINQVRSYYENRYPGKVVPQAPFAVATIGFGGVDPALGHRRRPCCP